MKKSPRFAGLSDSASLHNSLCRPYHAVWQREQKQKYLPLLATGQWIGAWGLTEPNTGSDAGRMQCVAHKDGTALCAQWGNPRITHGISGHVAVVVPGQVNCSTATE
ncbi:MAG: hypothetical protein R2792_03450 [Saprospiraceae bacterium]